MQFTEMKWSKRRRCFLLVSFVWSSLLDVAASVTNTSAVWSPKRKETYDSNLFETSPKIEVVGPTEFPLPIRNLNTDGRKASVIVTPTFGTHRADADAIFAYAEGYTLPYYMIFLESLKETGYDGDVVLAIAHDSYLREGVKDYLLDYISQAHETKGVPNLIVYQIDLDCDGTEDGKRDMNDKTNMASIFQMCRLDHVYGYRDPATNTTVPLKDSREGRVVATLRYEWYWIWSLQYNAHSWIMLIDARDTYFQTNPFVNLPRSKNHQGLLYLFGENADATRLGKSKKNNSWLRIGYGRAVIAALRYKPVICSGSTMGEQIAIETYLRALINEHDECSIRMTGSDQGFHNYLYYSGKLLNAKTISRVVVWEQGRGIINNLGALRGDSLTNWGMRDPVTSKVYQWDGATLSPVLHQWDRDKDLDGFVSRRKNEWYRQWVAKRRQEKRKNVESMRID